MARSRDAAGVCVFAPAPIVTVTIESRPEEAEELHLHAGGQGFWVARMLQTLGAEPVLCAPLGGETGSVLAHLIAVSGIALRRVPARGPSGSYVHDRRGRERVELWRAPLTPLLRHEVDDLFTVTLAEALEHGVCVVTGTHEADDVLPEGTYERLVADLRANGVTVVADLSRTPLREALAGGVDLLKVSHEELLRDGWIERADEAGVREAIGRLRDAGAGGVVVSRAADGVVAWLEGRWLAARGPAMTVVDPRGAGDSMTAALAFGVVQDRPAGDLLRLAVAAGAVNVTRHGLGSGDRDAIERLAERVELRDLAGVRS